MKRFFALMVSFVMVLSVMPAGIFSSAAEGEPTVQAEAVLTYTVEGGEATVTECDTSAAGALEIPAILGGAPVTAIGNGAFRNCTGLTSIKIPQGVITLGRSVFSGCTGLTAMVLPDSVTTTGRALFSGCTALETVTLSDGMDAIGSSAFNGCSALKTVEFPAQLETIGVSAFLNCTGLTALAIPACVTTIGVSALEGCTSLQELSLPFTGNTYNGTENTHFGYIFAANSSSVEKIPASLKCVTVDGASAIPEYAFKNCAGLTSVTVGDRVETIGKGAFEGCTGLESLKLPFIGNTPEGTENTHIGYIFGASSFHGHSAVPSSLKRVEVTAASNLGDYALYNLDALEQIVLGPGVKTIGSKTFEGCSKLVSVDLPQTLETIGNMAFAYCTSLSSFEIPQSVRTVGLGAFKECSALTSIAIGSGVQTIGKNAFFNCSALEKIYIDDVAAWCNIAYPEADELTYPLRWGDQLYLNGELITDLVIPEGITAIPEWAFACSNITSVILPDSVKSIGNAAFHDASALVSVELGEGVETIGDFAFCNCSALASINLHDGITSIGKSAFKKCGALSSVHIPKELTEIRDETFLGCVGLTSVVLPEGLVRIGRYAFDQCKLSMITLPKSLETIDYCAFWNSRKMEMVWYTGTQERRQEMVIENGNIYLTASVWTYEACPVGDYHKYDNACDTDCNVCDAERITSHSFGAYIYNEDATATADGTKTRTCTACGHPETVRAEGTQWKNPFVDVPSGEYYTDPVLWAVAKKVTTGTDPTHFSPDATCTRGQIVTFLWRAAGSPEPQGGVNPFEDVPADQYYYKAVLWAVEKGITTGIDATHFAPDDSCTRGQIVTFLWRAKGKPAVRAANPFGDVPADQYYYSAVLWAVKEEITNGTSPITFASDAPCTRAQIVTFLYRAYN